MQPMHAPPLCLNPNIPNKLAPSIAVVPVQKRIATRKRAAWRDGAGVGEWYSPVPPQTIGWHKAHRGKASRAAWRGV